MKKCRSCRLKARAGLYCYPHFIWEIIKFPFHIFWLCLTDQYDDYMNYKDVEEEILRHRAKMNPECQKELDDYLFRKLEEDLKK